MKRVDRASARRPSYGVTGVTACFGMTAVFGFGFLIGRVVEPVPARPAGVPGLAWLAFVLLLGAILTPLVKTAVWKCRPTRPADRQPTIDTLDTDAALESFPPEQPASVAKLETRASETPGPRLVKIAS